MTDQELSNYDKLVEFLYIRATELQSNLRLLAQDFKAMGMSDEDVAIELSFAMLHEGYRLRCVIEEMAVKESPNIK